MTTHGELLRQYAKELRQAKEFAESWWSELKKRERSAAASPKEAERRLQQRWPAGPVSHPRVLAVVRKYWLACDALNDAVARERGPDEAEALEPVYELAPMPEPEGEGEGESEEEENDADEVDPHLFVLEWLFDGEHDDLATFLRALTYWPVGVDQDGRYV